LIIRTATLGGAITYLALAGYALRHALSFGGGSKYPGERVLAQQVMAPPFTKKPLPNA